AYKGGSFQIHLDRPDGPVIGETVVEETRERKTFTIPLRPTEGRHDLYFTFRNPTMKIERPVCAVDWVAFRGDLPGKGKPGFANISREFMDLVNAKAPTTPITLE